MAEHTILRDRPLTDPVGDPALYEDINELFQSRIVSWDWGQGEIPYAVRDGVLDQLAFPTDSNDNDALLTSNTDTGLPEWSRTLSASYTMSGTWDITGTLEFDGWGTGSIGYTNASDVWTELGIGNAGDILGITAGLPAWQTPATYLSHDLLDGSYHPDTAAASPVLGDIIIAAAGPLWNALPIGAAGAGLFVNAAGNAPFWFPIGAANAFLQVNGAGNQPIWNILPQNLLQFFNGIFLETFNALITSDGATITMSIEKDGTGDLTMVFSDGSTNLDCTPAATIALTAGSDTSPQANFIYILQSTKVLTKSTTAWPTAEHIKVGYFLVQSAGTVQTDGALVNQNWNDHTSDQTTSLGHLSHMTERMRSQSAIYKSGIAGTISITTNVGTPDNVDLDFTAGVVYQMHRHATPVFDTSAGDKIYVVNDNTTPYTTTTDIADLLTDSAGVSMSGKYFNLVFWCVANKSGEYAPCMVNLPGGSYNTQAGAIADTDGYDNFTIPAAFNSDSSTGFLTYRYTFKHSAASGGTWTLEDTVDLRGQTPFSAAGGGSSTSLTSFADNQFSIFDDSDATKLLTWQLSGITTATTRTITMMDADLDLTNPAFPGYLRVGSSTDAVAAGDISSHTAASGGFFYDASAVELTLGTNGRLGAGAHGWTLAASDFAVGSAATSRVVWDDSGGDFYIRHVGADFRLGMIDGTNSGIRMLADFTGVDFIQAGSGGGDTAANLRICRAFTASTALNALDIIANQIGFGTTAAAGTLATFTQPAGTSGTPQLQRFNAGIHTGVTAGAECVDVSYNLARTVTWATGALAAQRSISILAQTIAFAGASTCSDAATFYINNAPQAGANATLTRAMAVWVDAGWSRFDGGLSVGSITTEPAAGKIHCSSEIEIDGNLNHDGSNCGFYGTAPVAQAAHVADPAYTAASATGAAPAGGDSMDASRVPDKVDVDAAISQINSNVSANNAAIDAILVVLENLGLKASA